MMIDHKQLVYQKGDGWFFSDETYDEHGPFLTEEEASSMLNKYIKWLETGVIDEEDEL